MSSAIMRRRAALQSVLDEYPGVEFGILSNAHSGYPMQISIPLVYSPWVDVPSNCTSITICYYIGTFIYNTVVCLQILRGDDTVGYYNVISTNLNSRTIEKPSLGWQKVRMGMNLDRIDDCYIKDNTNNVYLWKGKNVVGGVVSNLIINSLCCLNERRAA